MKRIYNLFRKYINLFENKLFYFSTSLTKYVIIIFISICSKVCEWIMSCFF